MHACIHTYIHTGLSTYVHPHTHTYIYIYIYIYIYTYTYIIVYYIKHNIILYYHILYYIILYYIIFYSILFYSILFYSILFYSILFYYIIHTHTYIDTHICINVCIMDLTGARLDCREEGLVLLARGPLGEASGVRRKLGFLSGFLQGVFSRVLHGCYRVSRVLRVWGFRVWGFRILGCGVFRF